MSARVSCEFSRTTERNFPSVGNPARCGDGGITVGGEKCFPVPQTRAMKRARPLRVPDRMQFRKEAVVTHTLSFHRAGAALGGFLEHAAAVVIGLIMMVVGLGLGVTVIMLPVGLPIGLLGVALVVGGLFAHID